mmetsp:Transcript_60085/g.123397  ORF Transcript_60085/g.123397 Transcript_60085/m.123397 type:complete len:258 (+) Transcript_60085:306-1079(+)
MSGWLRVTSSGSNVSQGSSGVHCTSATWSLSVRERPANELRIPRSVGASSTWTASFDAAGLVPWNASTEYAPSKPRISVTTAVVGPPIAFSEPSGARGSLRALPLTRLTVSRSILARSCRECMERAASAWSGASKEAATTEAPVQLASSRSSARHTSEASSARPSSVVSSASEARAAVLPRRECGPRLAQCTATFSLTTEYWSPAPPRFSDPLPGDVRSATLPTRAPPMSKPSTKRELAACGDVCEIPVGCKYGVWI